jgi:hypothetical protein
LLPAVLPAGSETLCATLWRTVMRVRTHDSGFEGERTRPLSLVNALIKLYLENVPVEHFQRVDTEKLISVGLTVIKISDKTNLSGCNALY